MKKAVILTGTPGTGKTTIACELAKKGYKVIDVNQLVREKSLHTGYDERRKCYIVDDEKLEEALVKIISTHDEDRPLILDGHVAVIPPEYLHICIVLRCSIRELRKRLVEKGYHEAKIEENVEAEIMEVILTDMYEQYTPENVRVIYTDAPLEDTVKAVIETIELKE